jgi:hypothetical protein
VTGTTPGRAFTIDATARGAARRAGARREGGMTVLRALRGAGLRDEVFVTVADVVVDEARHDGVRHVFDVAAGGAALVAEGRAPNGAFTFRRRRFNAR